MPKQSAPPEPAGIAPKLVEVTDEVLFADVRERPGPSPRDLSEAITRLAFYAGRPNAMTSVDQLKKIADERNGSKG
ncbi:hypothetical protein GCM10010129_67720 [Streptomyces fumigatiscleroticus]|nr:hypothetical protein GCM10010129_67720 [Streptomyces fumigatiscleroticus]